MSVGASPLKADGWRISSARGVRRGKIIQYAFMAQQSPANRAKLVQALRISTTPEE